MRVSVAVVFDTETERFHVYRENEMSALIEHLKKLDLVVGFNVLSFDYAVLKAYSPFDFSKLPTLDLLNEIHSHLGFRLSLDHLAEKTLGRRKESDGIQAVKWFREGEWDWIFDIRSESATSRRRDAPCEWQHGCWSIVGSRGLCLDRVSWMGEGQDFWQASQAGWKMDIGMVSALRGRSI
jgi:hypothetical protein